MLAAALAPSLASRQSAVLLLFVRGVGTEPARLVFTLRSQQVRSHRGQISFPGGRAEATDPGPAATALRELEEETGLAANRAQAVGILPPEQALDGHGVWPVVAVADVDESDFRPAADEVERLFTIPWDHFIGTPGPGGSMPRAPRLRLKVLGTWRESPAYPTPYGPIWGLTAKILERAALAR